MTAPAPVPQASAPGRTAARISGPAEAQRSGPSPQFEVDPGDGPAIYYAVEVASSTEVLPADGASDRTPASYYASWQDTGLMASSPYALPEQAWEQLRSGSQLVYRAWLSMDPTDWVDTVVTTPDEDLAGIPALEIVDTPPSATQVSDRGLELIGGFEGLRTELYDDQAGHCTIGYGHLVHRGRCDGS